MALQCGSNEGERLKKVLVQNLQTCHLMRYQNLKPCLSSQTSHISQLEKCILGVFISKLVTSFSSSGSSLMGF